MFLAKPQWYANLIYLFCVVKIAEICKNMPKYGLKENDEKNR